MIIADILRKKIKHAKRFLSDVWNGTDSDQIDINRFAGDLAKKDTRRTVTNPEKSQSVMQSVHDSKDAYVFLTYLNHPHKGWTYESVLDDHPLGISREIPHAIASLLIKMLRKNPSNRPDAATVFLTLKQIWDQLIKRETPSEVPSSENRKAEAPEELFFKRAGDL